MQFPANTIYCSSCGSDDMCRMGDMETLICLSCGKVTTNANKERST